MEEFNYFQHMYEFKHTPNIVVNCPTQELAREFLTLCIKEGFKFGLEAKVDYWNNEKRCYRGDSFPSINQDYIPYYRDKGKKIIEFKGWN